MAANPVEAQRVAANFAGTVADRIKPCGLVPTDEERAKLEESMIAYAGTYTGDNGKLVHHIDISWNEAWTGTDQDRFYTVGGNIRLHEKSTYL
jgi:hypothetical protein